jgi:hypothetical protein
MLYFMLGQFSIQTPDPWARICSVFPIDLDDYVCACVGTYITINYLRIIRAMISTRQSGY